MRFMRRHTTSSMLCLRTWRNILHRVGGLRFVHPVEVVAMGKLTQGQTWVLIKKVEVLAREIGLRDLFLTEAGHVAAEGQQS